MANYICMYVVFSKQENFAIKSSLIYYSPLVFSMLANSIVTVVVSWAS